MTLDFCPAIVQTEQTLADLFSPPQMEEVRFVCGNPLPCPEHLEQVESGLELSDNPENGHARDGSDNDRSGGAG